MDPRCPSRLATCPRVSIVQAPRRIPSLMLWSCDASFRIIWPPEHAPTRMATLGTGRRAIRDQGYQWWNILPLAVALLALLTASWIA
jgi:hypothetical protein